MLYSASMKWLILADLVIHAVAGCFDPTPAFPLPLYHKSQPELRAAFEHIQEEFDSLMSVSDYDASSFSVEITSSKEILWSSYHTAPIRNESRPGAKEVNGDSAYRIASITKTFTTLGILQEHAKGTLHLDTPVNHYIASLNDTQEGSIPWKDITLRSLASQLSGLPRDWSQGDLLPLTQDPTEIGLPPPHSSVLPSCYGYKDYKMPCTADDMLRFVKTLNPVYAPNAQSFYSNIGFEILGLVLANVSGMSYEDYIYENILKPFNLTGISFNTPPDDVAVLPKGDSWYWDVDQGVHKPTGGLYASASSMSTYLQYILTHYNGLHTGSNWLQPASFAHTTSSFYGMPWEIFHTSTPLLLPWTTRPVTFYTKSGGVPGYSTLIVLVPEYDLGITILVAGKSGLTAKLREFITTSLIRAADNIIWKQVNKRYSGTFKADHLNSSLVLEGDKTSGLVIKQFISNGSDVLEKLAPILGSLPKPGTKWQLIPTLLFVDEQNQQGEKWRAVIIPPRPGRKQHHDSDQFANPAAADQETLRGDEGIVAAQADTGNIDDAEERDQPRVWDEFCVTDLDVLMYDGNPLNEVIFWDLDKTAIHRSAQYEEPAERVQLTAFRVTMDRVEVKDEDENENENDNSEKEDSNWLGSVTRKIKNVYSKEREMSNGAKGELKRRTWNHGKAEL